MSARTKIVVLKMKEIIYTAIFIGLALLLILLLIIMFHPNADSAPSAEAAPTASTGAGSGVIGAASDEAGSFAAGSAAASAPVYTPGLYASAIVLGSENVNVEVTVDKDRIRSVALVPLSDSVTTMYPLMQPAMDSLAAQIVESQSLEGIEYEAGSQYTSTVLMRAIRAALAKAEP